MEFCSSFNLSISIRECSFYLFREYGTFRLLQAVY